MPGRPWVSRPRYLRGRGRLKLDRRLADVEGVTFSGPQFPQGVRPPPVSNTERQRQFRERNPGYFKKYYRRHHPAAVDRAAIQATAMPALAAPPTLALPEPAQQIGIVGLPAVRNAAPAIEQVAAAEPRLIGNGPTFLSGTFPIVTPATTPR